MRIYRYTCGDYRIFVRGQSAADCAGKLEQIGIPFFVSDMWVSSDVVPNIAWTCFLADDILAFSVAEDTLGVVSFDHRLEACDYRGKLCRRSRFLLMRLQDMVEAGLLDGLKQVDGTSPQFEVIRGDSRETGVPAFARALEEAVTCNA